VTAWGLAILDLQSGQVGTFNLICILYLILSFFVAIMFLVEQTEVFGKTFLIKDPDGHIIRVSSAG